MTHQIIIVGALGKMGREIAEIVLSDSQCELIGAIEYTGHPSIGKDYGASIGKNLHPLSISTGLQEITYVNGTCIDFSSPASLHNLLPDAVEKNTPVVVGTTGLSENDISFLKSFSGKIPVLYSPNMSFGVNILFMLTEMVSSKLKDSYDIEIIESHHRFKKDAPSGTAKRLGQIVASSLGLPYEQCVHDGRKGIYSSGRTGSEVGMHAIRGGDIVGDHTVLFAGIGERLELKHIAHSRSNFASGAVLAAKWLSRQKPGFYSMRNVLEI